MNQQPMNIHQLFAQQHLVSQQQYQENLAIVESGYESLMKEEQASFERMQKEHENRMKMFGEIRAQQIAALKQQYAITE